MNKAKKILYATLIGLTALTSSPYQAQANDKGKNPDAFYYTSWVDKNGDGKHQIGECENALAIDHGMVYNYVNENLFLYLNPKRKYKPSFEKRYEEDGEMKLEKIVQTPEEEIYKLHSDKELNSYRVELNNKKFTSFLNWGIRSKKEE